MLGLCEHLSGGFPAGTAIALLDSGSHIGASDNQMSAPASIHAFLGEARVPYTVMPHQTAFTAQEEAAAMHVPGRDWAKVVICVTDQKPIQAVLPAPARRESRSIVGAGWRELDSVRARTRAARAVSRL